MSEIQTVTTNLTLNESGLWVARDKSDISYPEDGNATCFEVEEESFWFKHRNNVITSLVQSFAPTGAVFDVGGGNGYVAMALQNAGIETVLVEPGPIGARNGKARGLNTVIQSTLEDAGFKDESIAAFGLFDVLEHIEDDLSFLRTLHRHLQIEGHFYLTVPAFNFLWSVDDKHAGHYRRYTTAMLARRLESTGFVLKFCSYFFWFLVPPLFLLRSVPSWFGVRRRTTKSDTKREHSAPKGIGNTVLDRCLAVELKLIEKKKRMPIGTSCIAVAQKVS